MVRPQLRAEAFERMASLMRLAVAAGDGAAAQRYAGVARRMSTRHRIRMPYVMRMTFCKRCKTFIPPGPGSRVRLGTAPRAIYITCRLCGHTYRKILDKSHSSGV